MDDRKDVVVIGGGLAGLVAGALVARTGTTTLVLDSHGLGGRARSSETDGFRFNQGPHALYEGCEAMAALDELGVAVPGGAPSTRIGVIVDGRRQRLPVGAATMLRTGALHGKGRLAAANLLATLGRQKPADLVGRSVDEWLDDRRLPADAEALVRLLVRVSTYANAMDDLDAGAALAQMQRAVKGVRYLDGGWQAMIDGVAAAATAEGATIVDHVGVSRIEREARGWTVVTATGEVHASSVIVAAGGPTVAGRLLGVDAGEFGDPGPAARATCLDLGLAAPARELVLFSTDEPLYYSTHMPPAQLGPEGTVVAHVARYLAPGESPTADAGRKDLWDHARRAGVGEGTAEVLVDRYLHDMTVTHGIPLARQGGLAGRPSVAVDGMPGVFLAGDWVGDTAMLSDAAAASARRAAELAVQHAGQHTAKVSA